MVTGLLQDCGLENAERISTLRRKCASGLEGFANIRGRRVRLRVLVPFGFPVAPPHLFVVQTDDLGQVPHLLPSGFVCVRETEDLVLDRSRPADIIRQWVEAGLRVLEEGLDGANASDLRSEWEVYWGGQAGIRTIENYFDPGEHLASLECWSQAGAPLAVAKDGGAPRVYNPMRQPPTGPRTAAVYIPMMGASDVTPPRWGEKWGLAELHERLLPDITDGARQDLEGVLSRRRVEVVVFGLPRSGQGRALFGVWFDGYQGPHPLLHPGSQTEVIPLYVQRLDRAFLVPRGGGHGDLVEKKVAVVGCGAVGGHMAVELVRSGVLRLTLVDFDIMRPENAFRHVLGNSAVGQPKTVALAAHIMQMFPYTEVEPIPVNAELLELFDRFSEFHAVVVATGNPALDLHLQAAMRGRGSPAFSIFTWLEPWGLGGHAVATDAASAGCLRCLYTDKAGEMAFRSSFAEPGQPFKVDVAGCGSRYTPFGSLDALRTAELATRLLVDKLQARVQGDVLRSWKGDPTAFRAAGLRTTDRFEMSTEELARFGVGWENAGCPECA